MSGGVTPSRPVHSSSCRPASGAGRTPAAPRPAATEALRSPGRYTPSATGGQRDQRAADESSGLRCEVLGRLADQGTTGFGVHVAGVPFGRVRRTGDSFAWEPVAWDLRRPAHRCSSPAGGPKRADAGLNEPYARPIAVARTGSDGLSASRRNTLSGRRCCTGRQTGAVGTENAETSTRRLDVVRIPQVRGAPVIRHLVSRGGRSHVRAGPDPNPFPHRRTPS